MLRPRIHPPQSPYPCTIQKDSLRDHWVDYFDLSRRKNEEGITKEKVQAGLWRRGGWIQRPLQNWYLLSIQQEEQKLLNETLWDFLPKWYNRCLSTRHQDLNRARDWCQCSQIKQDWLWFLIFCRVFGIRPIWSFWVLESRAFRGDFEGHK